MGIASERSFITAASTPGAVNDDCNNSSKHHQNSNSDSDGGASGDFRAMYTLIV
jgi:hypothetical protein